MALDIERIQWWVEARAIELRLRANQEKLKELEENDKTFCREVKLKNQNNEQDNKTNHKD